MEQHPPNVGYHVNTITKGVLGESSKLREEIEELIDAEEQGAKIMALLELADLYGAIEAYLEKHYVSFTMEDLRSMATLTKRAFISGVRK